VFELNIFKNVFYRFHHNVEIQETYVVWETLTSL